jgi:ATP-dependent Clp protease protease subunit
MFMPIGVPRVGYRLPGESLPQWVDLYNRLYRERVLFLASDINDELANQLVAIIIYLGAEDASKKLFMYINSPGGGVTSGISIFDAMNYVTCQVTTICVGIAASMASFVLAGGARGQRIALPHSRVMIHQPQSGTMGAATSVWVDMAEVRRLRNKVAEIYMRKTRQPLAVISRDMDRDRFMSADEAQKYGVVDHVITNTPNSKPFLSSDK